MKMKMIVNAFMKPFQSLLSYFLNLDHMHVRITERGRRLLRNKPLADKVVEQIQKNKSKLEKGETIDVSENDEKVSVRFATTIKKELKQ